MSLQNDVERLAGKVARALTGSAPQNAAPPQASRAQKTVIELPGDNSARGSSYRGASQNGTLDGLDQSAPLSPAARAELNPRIRPPNPTGTLDGVPWPCREQVLAFDEDLAIEGYVRPYAAYISLVELDAPFNRLQEAISKVTRSQHPAYLAHVEDIAKRTAAGDETVHEQDAWTKADFESDARTRLDAFKAELNRIQAQAWAIAEPALKEKAEFASRRADELEDTARLPYDRYHAPYRPPTYVLLLRKYAESLANGSRRTAGLPSSMIETL